MGRRASSHVSCRACKPFACFAVLARPAGSSVLLCALLFKIRFFGVHLWLKLLLKGDHAGFGPIFGRQVSFRSPGGVRGNKTLRFSVIFPSLGTSGSSQKRVRYRLTITAAVLLVQIIVVSAAPPVESILRPRGIYVLDSSQGTITNGVSMRDANIRSNSFVNGYMLRAPWDLLEPSQDQYDFTIIDWNVRKLRALGLHLSLQIVFPEPGYIANAPGALKWFDADPHTSAWRPAP